MCESKVQAWVKPKASARLVSSTTRQAGGSVCRVTPKSMLPPSILPRAGDGGGRAEGYVDPAGDVTAQPPEALALAVPPQPVGRRTAEQRVEAVGEEPEGGERGAEYQHLRPGRAPRGIHELRQEGQEEERDLGVQNLHEHALREDAGEAGLSPGRWRFVLAASGQDVLETEPDEVGRAEPLHDREGGRRRGHDRREPRRREDHVHQGSQLHAQDRDETRRASPLHAAGDDVEDRRAGYEQQRERRCDEEGEGGRIWHRWLLTWPRAPGAPAGRGRGSCSGAGTRAPRRRT